jgi:hypothetical protein
MLLAHFVLTKVGHVIRPAYGRQVAVMRVAVVRIRRLGISDSDTFHNPSLCESKDAQAESSAVFRFAIRSIFGPGDRPIGRAFSFKNSVGITPSNPFRPVRPLDATDLAP